MRRLRGVLVCVAACFFATLAFRASASPVSIVAAGGDGRLYDLNTSSGALFNPRGSASPIPYTGIAYVPGEGLYGVTLGNDNKLYRVDAMTGERTTIGPTGRDIYEGDLVYRPGAGTLLGINYQGPFYRVDRSTGATTLLGTTPPRPDGGRELSGLAFDRAGTLYAIDTGVDSSAADHLLTLDPTNGQVLSEIAITGGNLLAGVGMVFHPDTGTLYVAEGGFRQTHEPILYTLDPSTGALTIVGPLGVPDGVSGLAVLPEPAFASALAAATTFLLRRRR
jgi:hypothetical protein